jgi:hypothetical protein
MSDSLILNLNRANELRVIDPDTLSHSDDLQPILLIAAAIIVAGYKGVAIDEIRLANGRYLQAIDVNKSTPEGAILERLQRIANLGGVLPDSETVVASIRQEYGRISGNKGAPLHRGTK